MRLEMTKQIEEAARRISTGKRRGAWLKNSGPLLMTHDCRERLLISRKGDYERVAC